jgi:ABC-type molybdate transport system permease subunit
MAAIFSCGLGGAAARPTRSVPALIAIAAGLAFFPIAWAVDKLAAASRFPILLYLILGPAVVGYTLARSFGRVPSQKRTKPSDV